MLLGTVSAGASWDLPDLGPGRLQAGTGGKLPGGLYEGQLLPGSLPRQGGVCLQRPNPGWHQLRQQVHAVKKVPCIQQIELQHFKNVHKLLCKED